MTLTQTQIDLIRASRSAMGGREGRIALLFYHRLFLLAPYMRGLFPTDPAARRQKLLDTIDFIHDHVDRPAHFGEAVADLGRRHLACGVSAQDYPPAAEALIWALEQGLGLRFDPATRDAWLLAHEAVARGMRAAVAQT